MNSKRIFYSSLSSNLRGFLDEKRALGYKYKAEENVLFRLDAFWAKHNYGLSGLTIESMDEWLTMGENEGPSGLLQRVSVAREFSKYLNGIGIDSYIPKVEVRYMKPIIHILSQEEITALFKQIDSHSSLNYKRISDEYPVLYRLIYLEGLRISEACTLPVSQIDLHNGIITLLDCKNQTDRLIYMADDMRALCASYLRYLQRTLNCEPLWLFPGKDPSHSISISGVEKQFNKCWKKTEFAKNCNIKPTVHSLRHAFVVNKINSWMEQGLDFEHMLPYLSSFLGHKSFDESFYYYHHSKKAEEILRKKDSVLDRVIPEVIPR